MTFYPFLPQSEWELTVTMLCIFVIGTAWVFGKMWLAARSGPNLRTRE